MKNIHVIPTDKPSRVYNILGSKRIGFTSNDPFYTENFGGGTQNQNIYITNDEEIKEGEYGICLNLVREGFKSHQAVFKMDAEQRQAMEDLGGQKKAEVLKVILTTDQDLINDDVQAIDDEFLEWFVKNPSCESVEVVDNLKYFNVDELRERHIKKLPYLYSEKIGYKIIIPQEEPKQDYSGVHLRHCYQGEYEDSCKYGENDCSTKPLEPKQRLEKYSERFDNDKSPIGNTETWGKRMVKETLEEAVKRIYPEDEQWTDKHIFNLGAKWQAERSYSEEEVIELLKTFDIKFNSGIVERNKGIKEWFEQFKKK
jgi:hypothetical protein